MMWLLVTLAAYCLNGVAILVDKVLLRKVDKHPVVYAFYVSALGAVVLPVLFFVPLPRLDV
ncbi:MAG TPA: hypothetical protein VMC43_00260, partial [Candidatus Paceibacterota bacterium]|nr:hypothetical protein [Candidatus Paceibacterota bacterium]